MYARDREQELINIVDSNIELISELFERVKTLEQRLVTFTDTEINDLALKFQYEKSSEL